MSAMLDKLEAVNTVGRAANGQTIADHENPHVSVQIVEFNRGVQYAVGNSHMGRGLLEFSSDSMAKPRLYTGAPANEYFRQDKPEAALNFAQNFPMLQAELPGPEYATGVFDRMREYYANSLRDKP